MTMRCAIASRHTPCCSHCPHLFTHVCASLCSHMCARLFVRTYAWEDRSPCGTSVGTSDGGKNKAERHHCVLSRAVCATRTELRVLKRRSEKRNLCRFAPHSSPSCSHKFCRRRRSSPGIRSLHSRNSRRRSVLVRLPATLYYQRRR